MPAVAQGRRDAEAALQEAEEKLAASAAAAAQLEQQLAAAAPAAQAPVMSPAGCVAPATTLWTSTLLCAHAPLCSRVILRKLWACRLPVIAVCHGQGQRFCGCPWLSTCDMAHHVLQAHGQRSQGQ